jgi:hypothetical protein
MPVVGKLLRELLEEEVVILNALETEVLLLSLFPAYLIDQGITA